MRIAKLGFIAALLASIAVSAQAKSVKLEYRFKPGDIDKYKLSMNMKMQMPNMPGAPGGMQVNLVATYQQKVLGVLPDGSAKIQMRYTSIKADLPGAQSGTPPASQIPPVVMTMSRQGHVLAVEGMEKMMSSFGGMGSFDFSQFMGQMGQYGAFPEEPVEVGQSWTQTMSLPLGINMNIDSTLLAAALPVGKSTAAKVKNVIVGHLDLADLMKAASSAVQGKMSEQEQNVMASIGGKLDMSSWLVTYFSTQQGKILKGNGNIKATINIALPAEAVQAGGPREMKMTMEMDLNLSKVQ